MIRRSKMYNRQMRTILYLIIIVILLHTYSCSEMHTKIDLTKVYKNDLTILARNPDKEFDGVGVLPRKDLHTLEFLGESKIDLLSFQSCSREVILREPKSVFNKKRFIYNYRPNEIEASGNCPIRIFAVSKDGLYSGGFLDVQDESTTLTAHVVCGGVTEDLIGVSVCQERLGSTQLIRFDVDVMTSEEPNCKLESGDRGKSFEYIIKKGECLYDFIETQPPYRIHRLTTFGYEDIRVSI